MKKMKLSQHQVILLVILLLGLFLRIYDLTRESLWFDEGLSLSASYFSPAQIIRLVIAGSHKNPPLYYCLLHYWTVLFGDSDFSVRSMSAVFGFFSIVMIYKVGAILFDQKVGMWGSLLLALSAFHIQFSQEVRAYSLMSLLTLLSLYFFIKMLKERIRNVSIPYVLSTGLLMYTHVFGLFIVLVQNIYVAILLFLSRGVSVKRWMLLQGILVLLFMPWAGILMTKIARVQGNYWLPEPTGHTLYGAFLNYAGSPLALLSFLILSVVAAAPFERIRGSINWNRFFKPYKEYSGDVGLSTFERILLLLLWLLLPIILPFIISQFSQPIFHQKYAIGASLAFYLLVALGIERVNRKYVKVFIICVVTILSLIDVRGYNNTFHKEQWRKVAQYVDQNAEPGDLVLFVIPNFFLFDHYSQRNDLIKKRFQRKARQGARQVDEKAQEELARTAKDYKRVWVIFRGKYDRSFGDLEEGPLGVSHSLSYHKKYVRVEVYLFEKRAVQK